MPDPSTIPGITALGMLLIGGIMFYLVGGWLKRREDKRNGDD